jgi:hypothetical protein
MTDVNRYLIKTFISKALEMKGFNVSYQSYKHFMDTQSRLGCKILLEDIPKLQDDGDIINELLNEISSLTIIPSGQISYVAAFGYMQGILIHELRGHTVNTSEKNGIGLTSALLNLIICIFDYLVDEVPDGKQIFDIITTDLIMKIFNTSFISSTFKLDIPRVNPKVSKFVAILVHLFEIFTSSCRKLLNENNASTTRWNELALLLSQLYDAQRICTKSSPRYEILGKARYKSVMPSVAISAISQLPEESSHDEHKIRKIVELMGTVFWISDDLADIVEDLTTQSTSCITINVIDVITDNGSKFYETLYRKAIIPALETLLSALCELDEILKADVTFAKFTRFIRMYVAAWILY